jgi:hypothetical protein
VVEKGDDYDDGNWHPKQPKQYRAAHERLLICARFGIVVPIKRASYRFRSAIILTRSRMLA